MSALMKPVQKPVRGKRKIRRQMIFACTIALLLPLSILGALLISSAEGILNEHYLELMETDSRRIRTFLTEITTQVYDFAEDICFDNEIKQVLTREYETSQEYIAAINAIDTLDSMEYGSEALEGIYIYSDNPTISNYKQFCAVTEDVEASDWYQKSKSSSATFWTSVARAGNSSQNDNLCLVRKLALPNSDYHAVVLIRVSDAYIHYRVNFGTLINAIAVENGGVVYSSRQGWYHQGCPVPVDSEQTYYRFNEVAEVDGIRYFTSVSTVIPKRTDSRLYVFSLDDSGFQVIRNVVLTGIAMLAAALVIAGTILILFAEYFAGRVNLLREEMHKARVQDYNILSRFSGDDELTETFEDLKFMVQDIKEKDARMYEAELNEKELLNKQQRMEYKMLAHQINPHYLYNTLETIRMKALTGGNRDVADAIKILGKTLHYVLESTDMQVTTLHKELEHVKNYLSIQKLRFGERVNYEIRIEPDIDPGSYTLLPLLLQPVVENAVVHGLEGISGAGMIRIQAKKTERGKLEISVSDNGMGIDADELSRIHAMLEMPQRDPDSGIALYNIHRRVRLFCGEEYGIRLESAPDKGTRVILLLPGDIPETLD